MSSIGFFPLRIRRTALPVAAPGIAALQKGVLGCTVSPVPSFRGGMPGGDPARPAVGRSREAMDASALPVFGLPEAVFGSRISLHSKRREVQGKRFRVHRKPREVHRQPFPVHWKRRAVYGKRREVYREPRTVHRKPFPAYSKWPFSARKRPFLPIRRSFPSVDRLFHPDFATLAQKQTPLTPQKIHPIHPTHP